MPVPSPLPQGFRPLPHGRPPAASGGGGSPRRLSAQQKLMGARGSAIWGLRSAISRPGRHNAITDVPGVWVGQATVVRDEPSVARTGVTMVVPRENRIWDDYAFAGHHIFNGNGEMTGLAWLEESGLLGSAIGITNTHQVGLVRDALVAHAVEAGYPDPLHLPGGRRDLRRLAQRHRLVPARGCRRPGRAGLGRPGPGGRGQCRGRHRDDLSRLKGGIGTSSRVVEPGAAPSRWERWSRPTMGTVPACASTGCRWGGSSVRSTPLSPGARTAGRSSWSSPPTPRCWRCSAGGWPGGRPSDSPGSGGIGHDGSGDLFLAFATGNSLPAHQSNRYTLEMVPHEALDPCLRRRRRRHRGGDPQCPRRRRNHDRFPRPRRIRPAPGRLSRVAGPPPLVSGLSRSGPPPPAKPRERLDEPVGVFLVMLHREQPLQTPLPGQQITPRLKR